LRYLNKGTLWTKRNYLRSLKNLYQTLS
jgi:hypothetical protein